LIAAHGRAPYRAVMVAPLLTGKEETRALAELLRPEPLPDGAEPEERLIVCGVSWQRYLALDKALGDNRPGPRFYYLDGELEIMTTSNEHERIKKWWRICWQFTLRKPGLTSYPAARPHAASPEGDWRGTG